MCANAPYFVDSDHLLSRSVTAISGHERRIGGTPAISVNTLAHRVSSALIMPGIVIGIASVVLVVAPGGPTSRARSSSRPFPRA